MNTEQNTELTAESDPHTRGIADALDTLGATEAKSAPVGLEDRVMAKVAPVLGGRPSLRLAGDGPARPARWTGTALRLAAAIAIATGIVAVYMARQPQTPGGVVEMAQATDTEVELVDEIFGSGSSDLEQLIADADSLDMQLRSEWNPSEFFDEGAM